MATWVAWCHGMPRLAARCSVPAPQSMSRFTGPDDTQYAAAVRWADGATVPVPITVSRTLENARPEEYDAFEGRAVGRRQLGEIDPLGNDGPVRRRAVPLQ